MLSDPDVFTEFARQRGLAADGRCKAFSEAADGTAFAEGAGLLLVERLSDAVRLGHPVLAVLRGSAVNSDGESNGLTAPNGPSQQRVIRQALADARLSQADIDVVEAHGTGTSLGDPIEAQALLATYGQDRERPLLLGSVKSNLGHTQAAAGVAAVIKTVLALQHAHLPATLHAESPTSRVDWTRGAVELAREPREWPDTGRPRRAAVSSFGISGTNAHAVFEQAPAADSGTDLDRQDAVVPWAFSAASASALRDMAQRLADTAGTPADVGRALATGRATLSHRAVVLGSARTDFDTALRSFEVGETSAARVRRLAVVFPGQGAQRAGMGRSLHTAFPAFATAFDAACAELDRHLDRPLADVVFAPDGSAEAGLLNGTRYAQAGLFAVEVALFRLMESFGVRPDVVLGHSVGELAAAHVAGLLPLAEAARLVTARGRLMAALPAGGAMAAVSASAAEAERVLEPFGAAVSIAAVNGPSSVVVSGAEEAVSRVVDEFAARNRKTRRLQVGHAFHSALMDPMLAEFTAVASSVTFTAPVEAPRLVSTLTGAPAGTEVSTGRYWADHARQPVRFADAVRSAEALGVDTWFELGPDAVLSSLIPDCLEDGTAAVVEAVARKVSEEPAAWLTALAGLFTAGVEVDWAGAFPAGERAELPTYPFQRRRFWPDSTKRPAGWALDDTGHPLLGSAMDRPEGPLFTARIGTTAVPWTAEHAVLGSVLLPGAAFVDLAVSAGREAGVPVLDELTLHLPLVLTRDDVTVQTAVGPDTGGRRPVTVHSRAGESGEWVLHASGTLSVPAAEPAPDPALAGTWPPPGANPVAAEGLYAELAARGYDYGPLFRGAGAVWQRDGELFAEINLPGDSRQAGEHALHPALLDAALHPLSVPDQAADGPVRLPFAWERVVVHRPGASAVRIALRPSGDEGVSLTLADPSGRPVAEVGSLVSRPVAPDQLATRRPLFGLDWVPLPVPTTADEGAWRLCVVETAGAAGHAVTEVLRRLQDHLLDEPDARIAVVTRNAVAAEDPDPAAAAVWGLVRTAQHEHPGRIALADLSGPLPAEVPDAVRKAFAAGEDQIAVRGDRVLVPRLVEAKESAAASFGTGTVLITGGTGALGALVARHLVRAHQVRSLLLLSRRGEDAPGAAELIANLSAEGAQVSVTACDVADRDALATAIEGVRVSAVVHAAGITDDGLLDSLSSERVNSVFGPKARAAHHLHELTAGHELAAFVLFSSAAGVLGNPGQGNYAAANAYLDALARHRRQHGLPATSIAWGLWETADGLGRDAVVRYEETGAAVLTAETGLDLFDAAVNAESALVVAAPLDRAALRARRHEVPALLRGLAGTPVAKPVVPPPVGAEPLAHRLAGLSEEERARILLDTVRRETASVLGASGPDEVPPGAEFTRLGLDSLAVLRLRNRLVEATGLELAVGTVFAHPTPVALAGHLREELLADGFHDLVEALEQLDAVDPDVVANLLDDDVLDRVAELLAGLTEKWGD